MKKSLVVTVILAIVTMLAAGCAGTPSPAPAQTQEQAQTTTPTPLTIPTQTPKPAPTSTSVPSGEEGTFRLLVSDEENAINDFDELWVHITSIGVHQGGDSNNWIEPEDFEPVEVDLKQLIAENATEIWSGFLEAGVYNKVFIYVDNVTAVPDVPDVEVQLPGEKMHISKQFEVADGEVTNFVYDVTIMKAGESGKYILKPQIGESGADKKFNEVKPEGKTKRYEEKHKEEHGKGEDELELELIGEVGLGLEVTLIVTDGESPVEGATVTVNGVELETKTDTEGSVTILLPETPTKVKIEAFFEDKEGELEEFELEE